LTAAVLGIYFLTGVELNAELSIWAFKKVRPDNKMAESSSIGFITGVFGGKLVDILNLAL
jgi:hypothetical protein